ncbi:MAG TPA: D-hexose-6-phosphate mutarotase [Granulicella sp.]
MEPEKLDEQFGIPGVMSFHRTPDGLVYAAITTPAAAATVYLQGAHLAHWQPTGERPVLFLSKKTELKPGKAIRGGVPISFPWFAVDKKTDRVDGKPGPSHGFARTQEWTLAFAAVMGEDLHLSFTLGPTELSRRMGFDRFRMAFGLSIGRTLTMRLTVANEGETPLIFEEALHTYYAVEDVRSTTVTGLEPTSYLDKAAGGVTVPAELEPARFAGPTDRVYDHMESTCVIEDAGRKIIVEKDGSETTVVFNPWKAMADLGEEEWPNLLCVETANANESLITLAPGAGHTMTAKVRVEA